ncbi:MAG: type II/IV secretion system ATPase subunit [Candidatus Nanohaloarchaea archaeon]|nr:type II/IV secretion system ATPase subunit [Candidatus Nanohaloarchaea archaeon]
MTIEVSNLLRRLRKARQEGDLEEVEEERPVVVRERVRETGEEGEGREEKVPTRRVRDRTVEQRQEVEREETSREGSEKVGLSPAPYSGGEAEQTYSWEDEDVEEEEEVEEEEIDIRYPLIPSDPGEDEKVYAWAHIYYDEERGEVIYRVNEPDMSDRESDVLDKVEDRLKEKIDVDFGELKREEAQEFLREKITEIMEAEGFGLSKEERGRIQYYAYRNFVGLGKVEPLMNDKYIEDISCDGVDIPIYVYHRNPDIASVETDVVFEDEDELDSFVRKLAQRCGRSVSMAEPLVDGSLPDGSRVQATLATDIARRGSNFTIRKFTEEPMTPIDILDFGTVSPEMLAYLWVAIENGRSVLVAGPTASGKTTLLNALSLFIPPDLKIISIEDTPELRLPHPNWVPEVARSGFGFGEQQTGEVTLDDLLEESLRQRPDYIIVGEVRGEEAYILFQQIATGHPGMSTVHASSLSKVMDRLTTKPINLPPSLVENLDIVVFIKRIRRRGTYVRRVDAVYELEAYDEEEDRPVVNKIFDWNASTDQFENPSDSSVIAEIAEDRGIEPRQLQSEIVKRENIIEWMDREGITHYRDVGDIVGDYYRSPERVLEDVEEEV